MNYKDNKQDSFAETQTADPANSATELKTAEPAEIPAWARTSSLWDPQAGSSGGAAEQKQSYDTDKQQDSLINTDGVAPTENRDGIDPNTRRPLLQGKYVTKNVLLCNDGVYRWIYELNLLRHPTVFFTIWKIFFFIFTAIFAITAAADAIDWGRSLWESIVESAPMYAYLILGATGLTAIGYLIYVAATGGKLDVFYEMDEKGVKQKQIPRRAGNPRIRAEAEAGLRSDRISSMAVTEYDTYTEFSRVKKGRIYPISHYIKLKEGLNPDRIYADKEDFDFIRDFIIEHCKDLNDPDRGDLIKP